MLTDDENALYLLREIADHGRTNADTLLKAVSASPDAWQDEKDQEGIVNGTDVR